MMDTRPGHKGEVRYIHFRYQGRSLGQLPLDVESAEFHRRYAELLASIRVKPNPQAAGSMGALIIEYMNTEGGPYQKLSRHTKRNYARYLGRLDRFKNCRVSDIRPDHIQNLAEKLLKTPPTAKNFVKCCRVLFEYAKTKRLIAANPAECLAISHKSEPRKAWTDEECARFEASNPPRPLLTAYMLGRYTGQREGDILSWTRAKYDGEKLTFRQSKTYSRTKADLTIYTPTPLKVYLDALVRESTGSLYSSRCRMEPPTMTPTFVNSSEPRSMPAA